SSERVPSSLRGPLSDVYLPALATAQAEQLGRRLGDRATVDDPIFGRTNGMPALARYLDEIAAWLGKREGAFEKVAFTAGSDRDVTEGTLSLTFDGRRVSVPVAVVAERRREREVEVRLYYSTRPINGSHAVRSPLLPQDDETAVPPPVASHLEALSRGDVAAIVASFEPGGALRDAEGKIHEKGAGELAAHYQRLFGGSPGIHVLKGARADDGRTCALEYTVVSVRGKTVPPQAGLAVYERGTNGLLQAVRVYEDIEI
ncbi:MAG TPA: nuclear transport factor 2 family protein, partial [Polyangiaceae bacterium]